MKKNTTTTTAPATTAMHIDYTAALTYIDESGKRQVAFSAPLNGATIYAITGGEGMTEAYATLADYLRRNAYPFADAEAKAAAAVYAAAEDAEDEDGEDEDGGNAFRARWVIYPHATFDDGESVLRLATYAVKRHRAFLLRNTAAAEVILRQSKWEQEDEGGIASLAVLETLAKGGDDIAAYNAARAALMTDRRKMYRIADYELNPNRELLDAFAVRRYAQTFPALSALIATARDSVKMTTRQRQVTDMLADGVTPCDIMERLKIKRDAYYANQTAARWYLLEDMLAFPAAVRVAFKRDAKEGNVTTAAAAVYAAYIPAANAAALLSGGLNLAEEVANAAKLYKRAAKLNRW